MPLVLWLAPLWLLQTAVVGVVPVAVVVSRCQEPKTMAFRAWWNAFTRARERWIRLQSVPTSRSVVLILLVALAL